MTKLKVSIAWVVLLCGVPAKAFEFIPVQGYLKEDASYYFQALHGYNSADSLTEGAVATGISANDWGARLTPWLRVRPPAGQPNAETIFTPDLKEAWIEYIAPNWELRLGNQFLAWGTSDSVGPTDLWNAWDFTDPFAPIRLPSTAVKLDVHPVAAPRVSLQIIGTPVSRPNSLPLQIPRADQGAQSFAITDSRWLIGLPSQIALAENDVIPLQYEVAKADFPSELWEAGLRARLTRIGGWDFSLSGGQSVEKNPQLRLRQRGIAGSPTLPLVVTLMPRYYRTMMFGADASGTIGTTGFRLEIANRAPLESDPGLPAAVTFGVVGIDDTFILGSIGSELYLNLSYISKNQDETAQYPFVAGIGSYEPWDQDLGLHAELRIHKDNTLGFTSFYSFRNQDAWFSPSYARAFRYGLKGILTCDFFAGNRNGFFGQYEENSRARATLEWTF